MNRERLIAFVTGSICIVIGFVSGISYQQAVVLHEHHVPAVTCAAPTP